MDPMITTIGDLAVRVGAPLAAFILFMTIVWGWNNWARTKAEAHLSNQTAMMDKMCDTTEAMANSVEVICKTLDTVCATTRRLETMALVTDALQKAGGKPNEITP